MSARFAYLVKVEPNANNNKFYRMIENGSCFTVEYGRVGANPQTCTYPMSKWHTQYNSKIRKGYVDQTELVKEAIVIKQKKKYADISDPSVLDIVNRLQAMAKQKISDNYIVTSSNVTNAMVDEAQNIINELLIIHSVNDFNRKLIQLFRVLPRKMKNVSDYLSESHDNFEMIIAKEQDLLDIMRGQVNTNSVLDKEDEITDEAAVTILDAFGLIINPTHDGDVERIKRHLGGLADKYHNSWVVTNVKTQNRFDKFIADNGNIDVKLLWHGSRNENWWNIANSGLILRPTNAVITGKMFGMGTYFATRAKKSFGYTSYNGSLWAKGTAKNAFMGLYVVGYGKPYDVYSFESKYKTLNYDKLQQECKGAHCLHAHAGTMLKNDEIVVYKEEQTTIKYLVELK